MENDYQKAETKCRKQFSEFVASANTQLWNLIYQKDDFESTDVIMMSGACDVIAELKIRDYYHTKTWNGMPEGWVFEKLKFDALMSSIYSDKYFIIIFRDKVVVWNIESLKNKIKWQIDMLRKSSVGGSLEKKEKEVTYLPIEWASHIFNR